MSRSNPAQTPPAKYYYRWKGGAGKLAYWDKAAEKEIEAKLPFTFLVLDELSTVKGYCDQDGSGYWSNEVRRIGQDEITVKTSAGTKGVGLYRDLKSQITGLKYAASVYIAYQEDGEWIIANIQMTGAALSAWLDLGKKYILQNGKITLAGSTKDKKGATEYFIPTFTWDHSTPEEDREAMKLDRELQVYLAQYLSPRVEAHAEASDPELESLAASYGQTEEEAAQEMAMHL